MKEETLTRKQQQYELLEKQIRALLAGESDPIANAANCASVLYHELEDLNWAGFYFLRDGELVLGPFQGKTACVRIAMGKGVCGTAAEQQRSQLVADVHAFEGHIACDAASRSEVVVPLLKEGNLMGVLDLDSPVLSRFDEDDRRGLEAIARTYLESVRRDP